MVTESMAEKARRVEKMLQRALDVQEVQNVMARHSFLDAQGKNREQVNEIWAQKQPDVAFIQNHGMYVGLESIIRYYCDLWEQKSMPQMLERATQLYPEIPKEAANSLVGFCKMHTNCTPYIIIADDGQTAKATWESPGFGSGSGGQPRASWMWERFATDFIKEDGKWKIWHFCALVQIATAFEQSWVTSAFEPRMPQAAGFGQSPDVPVSINKAYSPKELCGPLTPGFPPQLVPYKTFSETFSYGPTREQLAKLGIKVNY